MFSKRVVIGAMVLLSIGLLILASSMLMASLFLFHTPRFNTLFISGMGIGILANIILICVSKLKAKQK
jgi:hypothetical protein